MEIKQVTHLDGKVLKGTISDGGGFVVVEKIDNLKPESVPAYLDTKKIDLLIEELQEARKLIQPLPTMEV